jgi:hypothetical protein
MHARAAHARPHGVLGQWFGQADLGGLCTDEWNTVRIPLSSALVSALGSGASDCLLRFTVSTSQTDTATTFAPDRVGFLD